MPVDLEGSKLFIVPSPGLTKVRHPVAPNILKLNICYLLHIPTQGFEILLYADLGIGWARVAIMGVSSRDTHSEVMPWVGKFGGCISRGAIGHCGSGRQREREVVAERGVSRRIAKDWKGDKSCLEKIERQIKGIWRRHKEDKKSRRPSIRSVQNTYNDNLIRRLHANHID